MGDGRRGERPGGRSRPGHQNLEKQIKELRQEVRGLKELLRLKDNSTTLLTSLLDQVVELLDVNDNAHVGTLRWIDKYSYGVEWKEGGPVSSVNKGNIIMVSPVGGES